MEEIFGNLISIDGECKRTLEELQEKKDNIEYLVNDELSKRKDEIKTRYKFKIDMRKNEYEMKLNEQAQKIEVEKQKEIENIQNNYNQEKENIIKQMIESII